MNIVQEPSVHIVGRSHIDPANMDLFLKVNGVQWNSDAPSSGEYLVEMAGRLCYMSFAKPRPGGNKAYIDHVLEVGHGSVLEHAVWNFIISGVSRSLTHELVRHRVGMSYSQLSQRYVDESAAEYVIPSVIEKNTAMKELWLKTISVSHDSYVALSEMLMTELKEEAYAKYVVETKDSDVEVDPISVWWAYLPQSQKTTLRKEARQAARSVLPNATETKIFVTANARALRHFIELRASRHADAEIRMLANKLHELLVKEAPNLFSDYEEEWLGDDTAELTTKRRKV